MKITNLLVGSLLLLSASSVNAQTSYGVKAGLNLTKTSHGAYPSQFSQKLYPSYFITAFAEVDLGRKFALQPGVSLQGKGDKYTVDGETAATWDVMSIEIPVNVLYYIPTGSAGSLFIGAGPYVGFNIAGKYNVETSGSPFFGTVGEHKMKFTGSDKDQKLIDAGANFLLGYKLAKGYVINAEYGLGITNIYPDTKSENLRNNTIRIGIGYQF